MFCIDRFDTARIPLGLLLHTASIFSTARQPYLIAVSLVRANMYARVWQFQRKARHQAGSMISVVARLATRTTRSRSNDPLSMVGGSGPNSGIGRREKRMGLFSSNHKTPRQGFSCLTDISLDDPVSHVEKRIPHRPF